MLSLFYSYLSYDLILVVSELWPFVQQPRLQQHRTNGIYTWSPKLWPLQYPAVTWLKSRCFGSPSTQPQGYFKCPPPVYLPSPSLPFWLLYITAILRTLSLTPQQTTQHHSTKPQPPPPPCTLQALPHLPDLYHLPLQWGLPSLALFEAATGHARPSSQGHSHCSPNSMHHTSLFPKLSVTYIIPTFLPWHLHAHICSLLPSSFCSHMHPMPSNPASLCSYHSISSPNLCMGLHGAFHLPAALLHCLLGSPTHLASNNTSFIMTTTGTGWIAVGK